MLGLQPPERSSGSKNVTSRSESALSAPEPENGNDDDDESQPLEAETPDIEFTPSSISSSVRDDKADPKAMGSSNQITGLDKVQPERTAWQRLRDGQESKDDEIPYPGAQSALGYRIGSRTMCSLMNGPVYSSWLEVNQALIASTDALIPAAGATAEARQPEDDVVYIIAQNYNNCGCVALSEDYKFLGFYLYKGMDSSQEWLLEDDMAFVPCGDLGGTLMAELNSFIEKYKHSQRLKYKKHPHQTLS